MSRGLFAYARILYEICGMALIKPSCDGELNMGIAAKHSDTYYERLKLLLLTSAFFCLIGAYTIAKELKNSVFAYIVGDDYIPYVRPLVWISLIPMVFIYSRLVDRLRRYQLLCVYAGFFALLGFVFAYYLGHPEIGIGNTDEQPSRLFGWIFYFFVEGYSPFVVSVFWAFSNSISSPDEARNNYGFMVSGSKLGGMVSSGLAWILVTRHTADGAQYFSDVINHQVLLVSSSLLLMCVPAIITIMIRRVPNKYLHGYEAVYQVEKQREQEGVSKDGVWAGLRMFIRYPYVLGVFGMSFFYEVVSTILSYLSVKVAKESGSTVSESLSYLLEIIFWTHAVGFLISFFGTSYLFKKLGTKRCLLLIPAAMGLILLGYMTNITYPYALTVAFVAMRAINYAFSWPLRESLYIPTVKDIKFKSKSWIDAFGSKLAKSSGSFFNIVARLAGPAYYVATYSVFFSTIVGLWMVTAWLLGRRFEQAVEDDEVIGVEAE